VSDELLDAGEYCRLVERYLCQKNEGHLVRIVGPAFERVSGWARRGVPLKIAYRGIDRCVERHRHRLPRRRPVRIEFCEADVLDVFDEWRRAVGVLEAGGAVPAPPAGDGGEDAADQRSPRRPSLPAQLERVLLRLSAFLATASAPAPVRAMAEHALREIDALRPSARNARGPARQAIIDRLRALDTALLDAGAAATAPETVAALRREATEELGPYRERMSDPAYAAAVEAAVRRLLRGRLGLPTVAAD